MCFVERNRENRETMVHLQSTVSGREAGRLTFSSADTYCRAAQLYVLERCMFLGSIVPDANSINTQYLIENSSRLTALISKLTLMSCNVTRTFVPIPNRLKQLYATESGEDLSTSLTTAHPMVCAILQISDPNLLKGKVGQLSHLC